MKLHISLLILLSIITSCDRRVEKISRLVLTTKNETNYSVSVTFFPTKGNVRLVEDLILPSLSQVDKTRVFDVSIVPIGDEFPFVSYGKLDSIRIIFNNSRFLSFRQPTNVNECNIPFNIFCASNHICTKQSDSKGQCTYTITEAMFNSAKPL